MLNQDCSIHTAGLWEQIWLWLVPYGAAGFLALVLFIASLCVLGYGAKNAKARKVIKVGILDYVLVLYSTLGLFLLVLCWKSFFLLLIVLTSGCLVL